jgi:hypothetical protein
MKHTLSFVVNHIDEDTTPIMVSLAEHYPDCAISLIRDGVPVPLKTRARIGEWIARYMKIGIDSGADYFIKIDPDASVIRRMKLPLMADVSCSKQYIPLKNGRDFMPRSGVIAFKRDAARKIHDEVLLDRYVNFPGTRDDYQEDIILNQAFRRLGLVVADRPDFACGAEKFGLITDITAFAHR